MSAVENAFSEVLAQTQSVVDELGQVVDNPGRINDLSTRLRQLAGRFDTLAGTVRSGRDLTQDTASTHTDPGTPQSLDATDATGPGDQS